MEMKEGWRKPEEQLHGSSGHPRQRKSAGAWAVQAGLVIVGGVISGLGVGLFYMPINLLGGGLTAIAIFGRALWGWNVARMTLLMNIPVLIVGYFLVNRSFMVLSTIGMLAFTGGIQLAGYFPVPTDSVLACIVGGACLTGAGGGLMLRNNGSGGGTDVVCRILFKYFAIPIGNTSLGINSVLICIGGLFLGIDTVIYTILTLFINSRVVNYIVEGINTKRTVIVITERADEMAEALMEEFGRGVTMTDVVGAYSGQPKKQLMCAISPLETPKLRKIVLEIEPQAFVTITESIAVIGGGFRNRHLD